MRRSLSFTVLAILVVALIPSVAFGGTPIPGFGYRIGGPHSLVNYNMTDPRWANEPWGGIAGLPPMDKTACGATSLAMVGATLDHNRAITPVRVARNWRQVISEGVVNWYTPHARDDISAAGRRMGLKVHNVKHNLNAVRKVVQKGGLAIALFSTGWFTHAGHYIVIRAASHRGFYLADPYGLGEFGHDNEDRPFTARFLEESGVLVAAWTFTK